MTRDTARKGKPKLSDHEQVMGFIHQSDHPLKEVMAAAREVILGANPEITEHIKWNAPSFCFNDDDRITLNLHNPAYILLVFHRGAKVKDGQGDSPSFHDTTGMLAWITQDRANLKLISLEDLRVKEERLTKVVNQWVTWVGE
jgi:hypothetical protein